MELLFIIILNKGYIYDSKEKIVSIIQKSCLPARDRRAGKAGTIKDQTYMNNCRLKILSKNDLGFISMPEDQDIIHLCFNNLLINFSKEDFFTFRKIVKGIFKENEPIPFPDGRQRILLNSPYQGINFSFDHFEMSELIRALDEAYYMERIYSYLQ